MAKSVKAADVHKIIIACEAGMGSSLMAANKLKGMLKKEGVSNVNVAHSPVSELKPDAQIVLVHEGLYTRARSKAPWAVVFPFKSFTNIPAFEQIVGSLKSGSDVVGQD